MCLYLLSPKQITRGTEPRIEEGGALDMKFQTKGTNPTREFQAEPCGYGQEPAVRKVSEFLVH